MIAAGSGILVIGNFSGRKGQVISPGTITKRYRKPQANTRLANLELARFNMVIAEYNFALVARKAMMQKFFGAHVLRNLTAVASGVLAAALSCGSTLANTVYTYTGNNYNFIQDLTPPDGTYDDSMRITGSFTLNNPLAANLNLVDITGPVQSFSFNDGRNTITDQNFTFADFIVSTDSSGALSAWSIRVAIGSLDPMQLLIRISTISNDLGETAQCVTFDSGGACTGFNPDEGIPIGNGVWVASTTPLPAALPLFATGIGGLGLLGWRRKRKARAVAA